MTSSNYPPRHSEQGAGSSSPYRSTPPPPPPGSRVANLHGNSAKAPSVDEVFDLGQDSNHSGKTKKKKGKWGKRIALGILILFLVGIIGGAGLFLYMYSKSTIPAPSEFALAQATTVYYNDGETEMGTFAEVNRTIIDINTLPDYVGQAVVASEDRTFFTNQGVDIKGIARAFLNNVRGGPRQGASTLSQQYVETYFGQETYGYKDKAKEAVMAIKINRTQSKDEILANYLNTIYFGRGANGIEAASKVFFGTPASELTLSQSALLAGIIPSPSNWDPAVGPDMAKQRWQRVLDLMVEDGWISQTEADQQVFPETIPPADGLSSMKGTNGYLLQQIRDELIDAEGFTAQDLDAGGLKIISTIDKDMQAAAVEASTNLPEGMPDTLHVALTTLDNKTGAILAEYAGPDYQERQINSATQERAMAGSTFKPFALIPYLEAGGSMEDTFDGNSPRTFGVNNEVEVQNAEGLSYGQVTLNTAVQKSLNTPFMDVSTKVGPQTTIDTLFAAGLPEDTPGLSPEIGNILGSASPHNIDMARIYATLANGGYKVNPHIVSEVQDSKGNTVFKAVDEWEQVFSSKTISMFLPALQSVTQEGGTAAAAAVIDRETAGKSGTSSDFRSSQFIGFIPQITTAVSMYNVGPNGEELSLPYINGQPFYGPPADVWVAYMQLILDKFPMAQFDWFDATVVQKPQVVEQPQSTGPTTPTQPETPEETVTCGENEVLVDGKCVAKPTEPVTCGENEVRVDGQCVAQPEEPQS